MSTRLIILFFAIAVIVIGALYYLFFIKTTQLSQQETNSSTELPIAGRTTTPSQSSNVGTTSQTLALIASDGGIVNVKNFLNDAETEADPINNGFYVLGYPLEKLSTDSIGSTSVPYLITYTVSTQYFNVELLQEPLGQSRELAQNYLQQHLGITEKDMCRLGYTLGAPNEVSQLYGGASLGFGFCPGAVKLPR